MSVLYSPTLKYTENCTEMDSGNGHPQQQRCHYQQSSGLLRYRSAPSSLLTSIAESSHGCADQMEEACRGLDPQHQQNRDVPSLGSEMEAMLAKLVSSSNNGWRNPNVNVKQEGEEAGDSVFCHDGPESDKLIHHSQELQDFPNNSFSSVMMINMDLDASNQSKMASGNCSNLLMRQRSSPAGFFSNFSVRSGFAALGEQATTSSSGLNGALTFSSRPSSCPRRMPQIAENRNETIEEEDEVATCAESRILRNGNGSNKCYMPSFTSDFWDSSSFTVQKPASDSNDFMFSTSDALESQHAEFGYQNPGLTHQLSLLNSSTKMDNMERFMRIQGSVPCKIRAKRGFATHPRSIAERVRRTRISERIKKLQELFPKSDKQTSTADMLDLAVDYIKDLQKQVKILRDTRAKCRCSSIQKQYS